MIKSYTDVNRMCLFAFSLPRVEEMIKLNITVMQNVGHINVCWIVDYFLYIMAKMDASLQVLAKSGPPQNHPRVMISEKFLRAPGDACPPWWNPANWGYPLWFK